MPKIELTDRFCRAAKPVSGPQTEFFDTSTKGLSLIASAGGTRTFYLHYTRGDGKRQRMKLGTYPEISLAKARERAREGRGDIGDGKDPVAEKRAQAAAMTVSELVESYIERHASTRKSADHIARRLRRDVSDVIGSIKLADLHRRDLTKCVDTVIDRGSPIAANRVFAAIRALMRWAVARGDLDHNLAEGMRRPVEKEPQRDRVLTADEIRIVWAALPDAGMRESTKRILRLCLITGQRVGEVVGMTRAELDLANAIWTIPAERTKNAQEHVVPLSGLAVDTIKAQLEDVEALAERKGRAVPPFVFPGPGARAAVRADSIPQAVSREKVTKRGKTTLLGVEPFTPHDLRRTAATHMEEIGISPFQIAHVLNHVSATKSSITSRVYARYDYGREKREALDLWADRLAGIIEGKGDVVPLRGAS